MKEKLLDTAKAHLAKLRALRKGVREYSKAQVQDRGLLSLVEAAARAWFDDLRPDLQSAGVPAATLQDMSVTFEKLLKLSKSRPSKNVLAQAVNICADAFNDEIVHKIEIGSFAAASSLSIAPYIEGLSLDEGEYLDEAQRCLTVNALRGCIVLGWCATIARIHAKIADIGYDKFSKATVDLTAKKAGRYKPFNKVYQVESLSELQRIFDTDILWVLEFMELIDGNQHQRLRHCFEFRNNSAHPGLAPIKGENLYSFYSDVSEIVLKNPKFARARSEGAGES